MRDVDTANTDAQRARIVEAAARCMARDGVARASVSDICREATMRPGHLYYYFPSKEAIFHAVLSRNRDRVIASIEHMLDGEDIAAQIFAVHQKAEDDRMAFGLTPAARVELQSYLSRHPQADQIILDISEPLAGVMRRAAVAAVAAGRLAPDTDIDTFINAVALIWQGLSFCRLTPSLDFDQMRKAVAVMLSPFAPPARSPGHP